MSRSCRSSSTWAASLDLFWFDRSRMMPDYRPAYIFTATVRETIYRGAQTFLYLDINGMPVNAVLQNAGVDPMNPTASPASTSVP